MFLFAIVETMPFFTRSNRTFTSCLDMKVAIGLNVDAPEQGGGGHGGSDWPEEVPEMSGGAVLLFIIAIMLYAMCGGGDLGDEREERRGDYESGSGGSAMVAGLLAEFLRVCKCATLSRLATKKPLRALSIIEYSLLMLTWQQNQNQQTYGSTSSYSGGSQQSSLPIWMTMGRNADPNSGSLTRNSIPNST